MFGFTIEGKRPNKGVWNWRKSCDVWEWTSTTYIGIKSEDKLYKVVNFEDFKLKFKQNQKVKVKAILKESNITSINPKLPTEIEVVRFQGKIRAILNPAYWGDYLLS